MVAQQCSSTWIDSFFGIWMGTGQSDASGEFEWMMHVNESMCVCACVQWHITGWHRAQHERMRLGREGHWVKLFGSRFWFDVKPDEYSRFVTHAIRRIENTTQGQHRLNVYGVTLSVWTGFFIWLTISPWNRANERINHHNFFHFVIEISIDLPLAKLNVLNEVINIEYAKHK